MSLQVKIIKDIPKDKIEKFEDRVVYNTAVETREYTKGIGAYPHLTGELERTEAGSPITGGNATYNLLAGVNYAKAVYNFTKAKWTNPSTVPHWYNNVYKKYQERILNSAITKANKEIK